MIGLRKSAKPLEKKLLAKRTTLTKASHGKCIMATKQSSR